MRLIILDLDETLIHASSKLEWYPFKIHRFGPYYIYERPGLKMFLSCIAKRYKLAVWTAASRDYADFVVSHILRPYLPPNFKLQFVFAEDECKVSKQLTGILKDISLVPGTGRPILIDDNPDVRAQTNEVITVSPFTGSVKDDILYRLIKELC